jgi:hypothetical protein
MLQTLNSISAQGGAGVIPGKITACIAYGGRPSGFPNPTGLQHVSPESCRGVRPCCDTPPFSLLSAYHRCHLQGQLAEVDS